MPTQPIKKEAGQTAEEMALQMLESQASNHLYGNRKGNYKEISDALKVEALGAAIDQKMQLLKATRERGRVDLKDLDEVSATAEEYMQSCKLAGVFPTMLGFAAACGYSRKHLYYYLEHNEHSATGQYINALRSSWAAILAEMGLARQASESVSIFLLKNSGQGMSDRAELEITTGNNDPIGAEKTAEELEAEYIDSVVSD